MQSLIDGFVHEQHHTEVDVNLRLGSCQASDQISVVLLINHDTWDESLSFGALDI